MASSYTLSSPPFSDDPASDSKTGAVIVETQRRTSGATANATHLSPFSPYMQTTSWSTPNASNTPAESISSQNSQYHHSDLSDFEVADPFFGVDLNNLEGSTPSFMDESHESLAPVSRTSSFGNISSSADGVDNTNASAATQNHIQRNHDDIYPLSPEPTASLHTASPVSDQRAAGRHLYDMMPDSVSPQDLQKPFTPRQPPATSSNPTLQLTPDLSGSGRSSEDELVQRRPTLPSQSPRVTVSLWGDAPSGPPIERTFTPDDSVPETGHHGVGMAGDLISPQGQATTMPPPPPPPKDGLGIRRQSLGRRGLDPQDRPDTEIQSVNESTKGREVEERKMVVDQWLDDNLVQSPSQEDKTPLPQSLDGADASFSPAVDDIPLGGTTENKHLVDQIYINEQGGQMNETDYDIFRQNIWSNGATTLPIIQPHGQRFESSNAAIAEFNRRCHDNESIVSKAATWGTRRRSLPSLFDVDTEGVTSGNLFKKLSINRGEGNRRPSLLKGLGGLVRRPSARDLLKRARSHHEDEDDQPEELSPEKKDSLPRLNSQARTSSWGKATVPSINTALINMGSGVASIGSTHHARTGSFGGNTPKSPKSPFSGGLQVKNTLQRRPRSKSDLPKSNAGENHSNLVNMWRKTGGPPVATLGTSANMDADDDDDEDEDAADEGDMKTESIKLMDGITPTFSGFRQHILRTNPALATDNTFLVDRIAHQQIIRYKSLLSSKVKHLQVVSGCSCGSLCIAGGGSANLLDQKGDARGLDPLSTGFEEDGDMTPIEGAITQESFPQDIPMPPTHRLPAEFECQLCFQAKKFTKPSDWTKHVHEDVQPFTCTWERCREPKIFKRKADWVRHENEGHRHLEWWTCDVEDCRHVCYRRDNFLQHLVREHKFAEPAVKTKAALKRAGGGDPTWRRVERCHVQTNKAPQQEPCRFCGKTFTSWKKLTVHLAKHMEQISLPVLQLVAQRELNADTLISPVQDAPPQAPFGTRDDASLGQNQFGDGGCLLPLYSSSMAQPQGVDAPYGNNGGAVFGYPAMSASQVQDSVLASGYGSGLGPSPVLEQPDSAGPFHQQPQLQYHHQTQPLSASTSPYAGSHRPYSSMSGGLEPFPALDQNALGLQQRDLGQMPMREQMSYDVFGGGQSDHANGHQYHFNQQPGLSTSAFRSHSPRQPGSGFYS